MQVNEIADRLRELSKRPIFLKCAVGVGLLMIVLIMLSDFSEDTQERSEVQTSQLSFKSADIYAEDVEKQLSETLAEIEGVGKAEVMLTITSTEEYVYAESIQSGESRTENSYVIIDKGSEKEALVKKINNPAINGVVVVCEGGDDPRVCEKIYKAVSTALDISTSKIYVAEMK